jgi:hypothetical protein
MSTKDRASATALAAALNEEYVARLPASQPRPRLQTLIGVAPAAPIVTGHPDSVRSPRAAAAAEASHAPPVSRVRPRVDPRPELPRSPMASKHTLDAVAINEEAPPAVRGPWRKRRGALLAALAALAVLALVGARRASHLLPVLAAEPPFAASIDLPSVSPATFAERSAAEAIPASSVEGAAPRSHRANTKPKTPARHKHTPKPPTHALP